ncbi:hypothetical protein EPO17_02175 [Patescibacteria group bacterium]|nr:MAG: hypothetical protein EPO17_02175 [Patescibacteria group bacterium]
MNNLLVFFTTRSKMNPISGPFGPFDTMGLAIEFAEAHNKVLKAERGASVEGFFTVPATSYGFDKDGKAIAKPLQS